VQNQSQEDQQAPNQGWLFLLVMKMVAGKRQGTAELPHKALQLGAAVQVQRGQEVRQPRKREGPEIYAVQLQWIKMSKTLDTAGSWTGVVECDSCWPLYA
jgi:hypothetical protein